jgi:hypothetical protein
MDGLATLLSAQIVHRVVSVRSESSGPYRVEFRSYEHAKFVSILRGQFDLQIEGHALPTRVRQGDCYLLADGRPYRIFNADVPDTDAGALFSAHRGADGIVRWGFGAVDTVTIGSRVLFNPEGMAWLRNRLPPLVHLSAGSAEAISFRALLTLLGTDPESAFGAPFVADRYVGLMLVQVLRYLLAAAGRNEPVGAEIS